MVWLDTGGMRVGGSPIPDLRMDATLEGFRMVGMNAALLSEREVYPGYRALLDWLPDIPFPMVSTNILRRRTQEPLVEPYIIEELPPPGKAKSKDPLRIAFLGLNRIPTWPNYSMHAGQFLVLDPVEAAASAVKELEEKADFLVALVYMNRKDARNLAEQVPEIDLILANSANRTPARPIPGKNLFGTTRIVFGRGLGAEVNEIRLFLKEAPSGGWQVEAKVHPILLREEYPQDPDARRLVERTLGEIADWKPEEAESSAAAAKAAE